VLVRDARARREQGAFVLEGPRAVAAALDRGAVLETVYLAPGADRAFAPLLERIAAAGIRTEHLKEGVLERISATVTPQPVLAVASQIIQPLDALADDGMLLVLVSVQDPGNAGTLIRSAEASGGAGVVCCGNSVDPHSPKVVRSSAGAIFGLAIAEGDDPVEVLAALGAGGRRRIGTAATGGDAPDQIDLTGPIALVLGNEAQGLPADLSDHLDATVTIPVSGPAVDSLNVAMAGTVLCFEAARQRRIGP
jgi:RNA methyltransferase, TrmH family